MFATAEERSVVTSHVPLLVVEQTLPDVRTSAGYQYTQYLGGIHPIRLPWIKKVWIVAPCVQQLYVVHQLDCCPHYHILSADLEAFKADCSRQAIDFQYLGADSSFATDDPMSFIRVWNYGTLEYKDLMKDGFDFVGMAEEAYYLAYLEEVDPLRGNHQQSGGITDQNWERHPQSGISRPSVYKHTDQFLDQLLALSQLTELCQMSIRPKLERNSRGNKYAYRLVPGNVLEGTTAAVILLGEVSAQNHSVAAAPVEFLRCHVDRGNCEEDGTNFSICASAVGVASGEKPDGSSTAEFICRVSAIGYERKICACRSEKEEWMAVLLDQMEQYVRSISVERRVLFDSYPTTVQFEEARGGLVRIPVHIDKWAFYSPFIDAILRVHGKFVLTAEQVIELSLVIGWANGVNRFWDVLSSWRDKGLPQNSNLAIAFVDHCRLRWGAVTGGSFVRFQSFFNVGIKESQVYTSCRAIQREIDRVNAEDIKSSGTKIVRKVYEKFIKNLEAACHGAGPLSTQHVANVLIGLGLIKHSSLGRQAVIATSTVSYKRLVSILNEAGFPGPEILKKPEHRRQVLSSLSYRLDTTDDTSENIVCKSGLGNNKFDAVFRGQPFYCPKPDGSGFEKFDGVRRSQYVPPAFPRESQHNRLSPSRRFHWWKPNHQLPIPTSRTRDKFVSAVISSEEFASVIPPRVQEEIYCRTHGSRKTRQRITVKVSTGRLQQLEKYRRLNLRSRTQGTDRSATDEGEVDVGRDNVTPPRFVKQSKVSATTEPKKRSATKPFGTRDSVNPLGFKSSTQLPLDQEEVIRKETGIYPTPWSPAVYVVASKKAVGKRKKEKQEDDMEDIEYANRKIWCRSTGDSRYVDSTQVSSHALEDGNLPSGDDLAIKVQFHIQEDLVRLAQASWISSDPTSRSRARTFSPKRHIHVQKVPLAGSPNDSVIREVGFEVHLDFDLPVMCGGTVAGTRESTNTCTPMGTITTISHQDVTKLVRTGLVKTHHGREVYKSIKLAVTACLLALCVKGGYPNCIKGCDRFAMGDVPGGYVACVRSNHDPTSGNPILVVLWSGPKLYIGTYHSLSDTSTLQWVQLDDGLLPSH